MTRPGIEANESTCARYSNSCEPQYPAYVVLPRARSSPFPSSSASWAAGDAPYAAAKAGVLNPADTFRISAAGAES